LVQKVKEKSIPGLEALDAVMALKSEEKDTFIGPNLPKIDIVEAYECFEQFLQLNQSKGKNVWPWRSGCCHGHGFKSKEKILLTDRLSPKQITFCHFS